MKKTWNIWTILVWILFLLFPFLGLFAQEALSEANNLKFQTHFFEAIKQKSIGNHEKAIESLEECDKIDKNNKAILFELSKNQLAIKNYYEAENAIEEALKLDTHNIFMLEHLVTVYKKQQQYGKAITIQEKIADTSTNHTEELVQLYLYNGDSKRALQYINETEQKSGLTATLINVKKRLLKQLSPKKIEEQVAVITQDITLEKFKQTKDFKLLKVLLSKAFNANDHQRTLEISEVGLQYFPAQASVYLQKAQALNKLQKYEDAIETLEIGLDFVIENQELSNNFYKQFVIAYQNSNQTKKATEFKQKIQ